MNFILISKYDIIDYCMFSEENFTVSDVVVWVSDYSLSYMSYSESEIVNHCIKQKRLFVFTCSRKEFSSLCVLHFKYGDRISITETSGLYQARKIENCRIINEDQVFGRIIEKESIKSISYERFKKRIENVILINKPG